MFQDHFILINLLYRKLSTFDHSNYCNYDPIALCEFVLDIFKMVGHIAHNCSSTCLLGSDLMLRLRTTYQGGHVLCREPNMAVGQGQWAVPRSAFLQCLWDAGEAVWG